MEKMENGKLLKAPKIMSGAGVYLRITVIITLGEMRVKTETQQKL